MTIITALLNRDLVYYGYNNGAILGDTAITDCYCPWVRLNDWTLGITGESAAQRVVEANSSELSRIKSTPQEFVSKLSEVLLNNYIGLKSEDVASYNYGIGCILIYKNLKIFDLCNSLSLTEMPSNRLWAQGSGADYAVGADFALMSCDQKISAEKRMEIATKSAVKNDIYCAGDVVIQTL